MNVATLALEAHRQDRVADAARYYRLLLEEQPQSAAAWLGYAMLLHMKAGDRNAAIPCYEQSLRLEPGALAHLHLGSLFAEADQQDKAIGHLGKYLELDPGAGSAAYGDLACALVRRGRLTEAQDVAAQCRRSHPDDFFAYFLSAWVAAKQEALPEALGYVTDAVALDPLWPVPLGLRGLLLWRLGRYDQARRVLQEIAAIQGGLLASSLSAEARLAANGLWRDVRRDAKRRLGIEDWQPANFILLNGGLGDQYGVASMLAHFRAANAPLPLVAFSSPSAVWEVLYPKAADLFLHLDPAQIGQLAACNRFFPDHPYTNFFPWFGPLVSLTYALPGGDFFLGLPQHARRQAPTIPAHVADKASAMFRDLGGRPGRSVLISPLSNSNPMAAQAWWQDLVDELRRAGFVVFQNMTNMLNTARPDHLSLAVPVDLPLEQIIPFAEACGFFIGVRSGLCDILGAADARKKAIHVTRRYARNDRYPLSVWLDSTSGFNVGHHHGNTSWQDIDIAAEAAFDPTLVADWVALSGAGVASRSTTPAMGAA